MDDLLILGGGVIGLSLAYELSGLGMRVRVIDRGAPGREASWAGAGILPPAGAATGGHPYEQLGRLSHELHSRWSAELRAETGIDNGYCRSGGVYLARDGASEQSLRQAAQEWRELGTSAGELSLAELAELEPSLACRSPAGHVRAAFWLRDEAQIRNPRHLKALAAACVQRGVEITAGAAAEDFALQGNRIRGVQTSAGTLLADQYCVASGPWSKLLLTRLGVQPALKPVRGQMVLLACPRPPLQRIIHEGPRYLVPRADGRVLVGSTEEDAGFDKWTTTAGVAGLVRFALELAPVLEQAQFEQCWAGLRPGTLDGLPYLGRVPGLENAYVAAGHFRSGLYLSPATAVVLGQLIRGQEPQVSLHPFRLDRR